MKSLCIRVCTVGSDESGQGAAGAHGVGLAGGRGGGRQVGGGVRGQSRDGVHVRWREIRHGAEGAERAGRKRAGAAAASRVRRRAAEGCWRRRRRERRAQTHVLREHDANKARWEVAQTAESGGRLAGVEGEGDGAGGWAGREREEAPTAGREAGRLWPAAAVEGKPKPNLIPCRIVNS
jgi:hypothetical protein